MNHGATEPRTDTGSPQGWLDRIAFLLVVLVFVAIMMVIVSLLDLGFGTAVSWVFGGIAPGDR